MQRHHILYIVVAIVFILSLIFIENNNSNNVSALNYKNNIGIGFTINPLLSLSISSSDLVISNLTPGSTADSNSINVNVTTNASYGYTLSVNASSENLVHSNNTNTFSGIATDADLSSLDDSEDNNIWGYSTSLDNGSSWSNYNGLSSSTSTTLIDKDDNTSSVVDLKIGAKASNAQASGTYTNTINFAVISKPIPMTLLDAFIASNATQQNGYYTMQGMTSDICNAAEEGSELQLLDERDNKLYWVAKLADKNCWMTQNLDLDLSHEMALTSKTSDINPESYGETIYINEAGYSKDETTGIVSWLPNNLDANNIQRANTINMTWNGNSATAPGWNNNYNRPYSANPGDKYLYIDSSNNTTNYKTLDDCIANTSDRIICQHTHLGNYYNWSAAVASNNTNNATGNQKNSICPKNWRLPIKGDYGAMLKAQKIWTGSAENYSTNGFYKIRTTPLYFVQSGRLNSGNLMNYKGIGNYWSATYSTSSIAYFLNISADYIRPQYSYNDSYGRRGSGWSIRCLAR